MSWDLELIKKKQKELHVILLEHHVKYIFITIGLDFGSPNYSDAFLF